MQNSENKIDGLFRDKLHDHKVVPPPAVWDNIAGALDGTKRKKRMVFVWGISLAASLLLAFLAGWYFSGQISPRGAMQSEQITPASNNPVQPATAQQSSVRSIASNESEKISASAYSVSNKERSSKIASSTTAGSTSIAPSRENFLIRLLSPLTTSVKSNHANDFRLIAMNDDSFFSEADRAIIASNVGSKEELVKSENHSKWSVGVQASPVYRFDQASSFNADNSDPMLTLESAGGSSKYITNVAGGVKVEYNTGSRLSVQSGVNYGEVAQNPGRVGVSFVGQDWFYNKTGTDDSKGLVSTPNEGNSLSNNMILKTQMGLANIEMPEGVGLAAVNVTNNYTSAVARNYDMEQQAGYLEIPLLVRYKIIDKRLGFLLLGGLNTNFLMSNNVSLVDNNQVIANGKIEGLNPLTFSSSVGMGINYAITNRFNLSVEPTMKIQLNSLNKQTSYNSKPYTVGIFTGVSYQF